MNPNKSSLPGLLGILFLSIFIFGPTGALQCQEKLQEVQKNKEVATSYLYKVVNQQDLSRMQSLFANDCLTHEMDGSNRHDIADSTKSRFLAYLFTAFPDLHYSIISSVAENDIVALNTVATGTHEAEFLGHEATHRKIRFSEMFFFRFSGNKIVEFWGVVDKDGVIAQISKKHDGG